MFYTISRQLEKLKQSSFLGFIANSNLVWSNLWICASINPINWSIRSEISCFRWIWWAKLDTDRSLKLIDCRSSFKVPEENERWNTCPSVGSSCFFFFNIFLFCFSSVVSFWGVGASWTLKVHCRPLLASFSNKQALYTHYPATVFLTYYTNKSIIFYILSF